MSAAHCRPVASVDARRDDPPMRLLVVEDHAMLAETIGQALREAGWATDVVGDGDDGLLMAQQGTYDVIVLDIMLPGRDGISVLRELRAKHVDAAVLLLTARDTVEDRVVGLDAGADDYLVKPFAVPELEARVRALLRRRYKLGHGTLEIADLRIDLHARRVWRGDQEIALSAREYAVLQILALRRGQIVTREELFESVYDMAAEPGSNVLDVHVKNLRKKVDRGFDPPLIHTLRGQGYMLDVR
jgi:two-component system copper resistance phosphate regulon response regulator CusR